MSVRRALVVGDRIEISFLYDEEIISVVREMQGRRWDRERKVWSVPLIAAPEVYTMLDRFGFLFDEALMSLVDGAERQHRNEPIPEVDFETVESGFTFKVQPYRHQKYGLKVALEHLDLYGCHAFLWEMGTGKTMAAINLLNILRRRRRVRKTLVIAPNSLMENWEREVGMHSDLRIRLLWGSRGNRLNELNRPADIYIINYEYVKPFEEALGKTKWDLMICDESTRIKSPDAAVSRAVARLGRSARYRVIMTGTPVTQSPQDAFSQFRFLNEQIFGWSPVNFRNTYCVMGGWGGYNIVGFKNQEQLRNKIERYSTRFLKQDCLDLPDKVFEDYAVELEPDQKKRYDEMAKMILREIEDEFGQAHRISAPIVLTKMLRLSQICGGHLRSVDGTVIEFGSGKDKVIGDLLNDLLYNGNKVIVWARFVPEILKLQKHCTEQGYDPEVIYGDVPMHLRDGKVQRFQTDPNCKVFIGQIGTAGFGINLTAASTAIYYSQDYSLEHYLQSQDRNHRIGVTADKVLYINLFCKGTIDQAIAKALSRKKGMANEVTGDDIYSMIYGT